MGNTLPKLHQVNEIAYKNGPNAIHGGIITSFDAYCRNPTLAKCGGEAQHLEKVRIWSPPGLPNV